MAIKKGVNHSNNKERCSAGNLDELLWKYYKSRYADLSCSDVHWDFWQMCNSLRLGSEVCDWYQPAISPIWRRRSTNVKKSLQSLFCILHPACVLLSVCSLQSAVCILHWPVAKLVCWWMQSCNIAVLFVELGWFGSDSCVSRVKQNTICLREVVCLYRYRLRMLVSLH